MNVASAGGRSSGTSGSARGSRSGCLGGSSGRRLVRRFSSSFAASGRSALRPPGHRDDGLARGEVAGNAGLNTLAVLLGGSRVFDDLVALLGALGGLNDLRGVRVGCAVASGLAVDVAGLARGNAALGGSEASDDRGRSGDGAGSLGTGEGAGDEGGQDDDGVLHFGCCSFWVKLEVLLK